MEIKVDEIAGIRLENGDIVGVDAMKKEHWENLPTYDDIITWNDVERDSETTIYFCDVTRKPLGQTSDDVIFQRSCLDE